MYPSVPGPSVVTDDDGYARLQDAWFQRPFYFPPPSKLIVTTNVGIWLFDYPPLDKLILDPGAPSFRPITHALVERAGGQAARPR